MLLRSIDQHCLKGSKVGLENWVVYWMLMRGLLRTGLEVIEFIAKDMY